MVSRHSCSLRIGCPEDIFTWRGLLLQPPCALLCRHLSGGLDCRGGAQRYTSKGMQPQAELILSPLSGIPFDSRFWKSGAEFWGGFSSILRGLLYHALRQRRRCTARACSVWRVSSELDPLFGIGFALQTCDTVYLIGLQIWCNGFYWLGTEFKSCSDIMWFLEGTFHHFGLGPQSNETRALLDLEFFQLWWWITFHIFSF